jgi:xanthine dehydrogenase accessory factor
LHLGTAALLDFHSRHRDDEALVLVTITSTRGSTYRKPGAMMLIAPDDSYEGLISGGCLEGDLLRHASRVFDEGGALPVTYDMHSDDDLVWGLGIGCDGVIELLLQRLDREFHQQFFGWIGRALAKRRRTILALVTDSEVGDLSPGMIAAMDSAGECFGDEALAGHLCERQGAGWPEGRFERWQSNGARVMLINLAPQPRILLCGGGPDAAPIAAQILALGWQCQVVDHRPAYAAAGRFPAGAEVTLCRPESLGETLSLADIDGAVIMSHHLESDAAYLRRLAPLVDAGSLHYLGVLGPVARRNRLKEMAECPGLLVRGPVGLDIGAELPESIALAVMAEIHAVFNARDGQSLTTGPVGDAG